MFRTLGTILSLLACGASTLAAQGAGSEVTEGRLIRLYLTDGRVVAAVYLAADADSVTLVQGGSDTVRVARTYISRIEAFVRLPNRTANATMIGGGIGLVAGLAIGSASCEDDWVMSSGECTAYTAFGVAAVGALLGMMVGTAMPTQRWQPAVFPAVKVIPDDSGGKTVAVGLRLRI